MCNNICSKCNLIMVNQYDLDIMHIHENKSCKSVYLCEICWTSTISTKGLIYDENFDQFLSKEDYEIRYLKKCYHCNEEVAGTKCSKIIMNGYSEQVHKDCMDNYTSAYVLEN